MAPLGCTELIQRSDFKSHLEDLEDKFWFLALSPAQYCSEQKTSWRFREKKISLCSLESGPSRTREHGINKICGLNEGGNIMSEMPVWQSNLCSITAAAGVLGDGNGWHAEGFVRLFCMILWNSTLCCLCWRSQSSFLEPEQWIWNKKCSVD